MPECLYIADSLSFTPPVHGTLCKTVDTSGKLSTAKNMLVNYHNTIDNLPTLSDTLSDASEKLPINSQFTGSFTSLILTHAFMHTHTPWQLFHIKWPWKMNVELYGTICGVQM